MQGCAAITTRSCSWAAGGRPADSFLECGHYGTTSSRDPASAAARLMFIPFFALQTLLFLRQSLASEDCQIPDGNCERRLRSAQCGRQK